MRNRITNLSGQIATVKNVDEQKQARLDISKLPKGIYLLEAIGAEKRAMKKFVKH